MHAFADRLARPVFQLDRQVVDFTGLKGTFDLTLDGARSLRRLTIQPMMYLAPRFSLRFRSNSDSTWNPERSRLQFLSWTTRIRPQARTRSPLR